MSQISINLDSLNSSNFKKTVRHKIQEGENVLRFLPPFGEACNGSPYVKWGVIWGFTDPNTGRNRPYASSSTYEGRCPVYDYLDQLKPTLEAVKSKLASNGLSEEAIKDQLKPVNDFISNIRPKTVYSYNAVDKSGQIGVVDIKSTAHKKIIKLMREYINDYSQDPTSLNNERHDSGVWFKITREGQYFDTKYDAFKNQIKVKNADTGVLNYEDDRSSLPDNIINNYNDLAYDLTSLYNKLSYNELKEVLVANIIAFSEEHGVNYVLLDGFGKEDKLNLASQQTHAQVPQGKTTINLNLGEEEDDAGSAVSQQVTTTSNTTSGNTGSKSSASDMDDVLAMADDIFNS
jgi:hypothetical protein